MRDWRQKTGGETAETAGERRRRRVRVRRTGGLHAAVTGTYSETQATDAGLGNNQTHSYSQS